jgi:ABC-type multidrug transport system fused ATPase/permease subunit
MVPHGVRALVGADARRVLPLSALGGGMLLCLADTVGRSVLPPIEIPAGVVTALIGAPWFLIMLRRATKWRPAMSSLRFDQVCFSYGTAPCVVQFSCNLAKGELVGLIGANGSGKSTLLRLGAGLLTPTVGQVELDGKTGPLLEG